MSLNVFALGLLSKWVDGPERAALVGRIVRRAGTFGGHFSSGGFAQ